MPIIPKHFPNVNAVLKIIADPCGPTPALWALVGAEAAAEAVWSAVDPGNWKTEVKIATGKSWLKHLKERAVNAHRELPTRAYKGLHFLFEFAEVVDMDVWYAFLTEFASDQLMNWTSMMYQVSGCTPAMRGNGIGYGPASFAILGDGLWHPAFIWHQYAPIERPLAGPVFSVPADTYANMSFSVAAHDIFLKAQPLNTRIRRQGDDQIEALVTLTQEDLDKGSNGCVLVGHSVAPLPFAASYVLEAQGFNGGLLAPSHGRAFCTFEHAGLFPRARKPHRYHSTPHAARNAKPPPRTRKHPRRS